jgi:hypothetical protein
MFDQQHRISIGKPGPGLQECKYYNFIVVTDDDQGLENTIMDQLIGTMMHQTNSLRCCFAS